MDRLDKTHKIGIAYDLIERVKEDTDEVLEAYCCLEDALAALDDYYEQVDFQE